MKKLIQHIKNNFRKWVKANIVDFDPYEKQEQIQPITPEDVSKRKDLFI